MTDKRTNDELADALEKEVDSREHTYEGVNTELLYAAADRLRSMPEGEVIEGWVHNDVTTYDDYRFLWPNKPVPGSYSPATLIIWYREDNNEV